MAAGAAEPGTSEVPEEAEGRAGAHGRAAAHGRAGARGRAEATEEAQGRTRAAGLLVRLVPLAVLALILAVATVLRFWDLGSNPGGLYGDEAAEGLDAWRLLHQPGFLPDFGVWFRDDGGREALFAYVVAAAFSILGATPLVLRGVAAAFGVAGVAAVFVLARRFGTWTALAAAAWAAGSLWLVAISRDGMRNAIVPFFGAVAMAALLRWADVGGRRWAAATGAVCSVAALYTYQPLKLLPVLVAIWWLWLRLRNRPAYDRLRPGIPAFGIAFLLVAAPMIAVAVTEPASYFGRIAATSPFGPGVAESANPIDHTLRTLGMFGFTGDPNARHDVAEAPLLSLPLVGVALAGLLRLWRCRHEPAAALILLSLPVFLVPPLLALDGGAPHFLRSLGLAAPLAVTIGLGMAEIADRALAVDRAQAFAQAFDRAFGRGRLLWGAAVCLVGAILALTPATSALLYFDRPAADRYQAYSYPLTAMADYAAAHPGTAVIADEHSGYVIAFLTAGKGIAVYTPGRPVPNPSAHPVYLASSAEDLRTALGEAAALRAVAVAWYPAGNPSVWMTTP